MTCNALCFSELIRTPLPSVARIDLLEQRELSVLAEALGEDRMVAAHAQNSGGRPPHGFGAGISRPMRLAALL